MNYDELKSIAIEFERAAHRRLGLLIACRSSVRLDWQNYERLLMNNTLSGSREAIENEAKRLHDLLVTIECEIEEPK